MQLSPQFNASVTGKVLSGHSPGLKTKAQQSLEEMCQCGILPKINGEARVQHQRDKASVVPYPRQRAYHPVKCEADAMLGKKALRFAGLTLPPPERAAARVAGKCKCAWRTSATACLPERNDSSHCWVACCAQNESATQDFVPLAALLEERRRREKKRVRVRDIVFGKPVWSRPSTGLEIRTRHL